MLTHHVSAATFHCNNGRFNRTTLEVYTTLSDYIQAETRMKHYLQNQFTCRKRFRHLRHAGSHNSREYYHLQAIRAEAKRQFFNSLKDLITITPNTIEALAAILNRHFSDYVAACESAHDIARRMINEISIDNSNQNNEAKTNIKPLSQYVIKTLPCVREGSKGADHKF